ncbi:S28 family serine protease [Solirubrobacter taibaiensis]|nr:S28 family serine protease [Solirubrobacter taibaiensis]
MKLAGTSSLRRALSVGAVALGLSAGPAHAQTDIAEQLRAIPGVENVTVGTVAQPYQFFRFTYRQPVDHARPGAGTFAQRATLLHRGLDRPTVFYTNGYDINPNPSRSEPTRLVDGNQLAIEHRFFETSVPTPVDWSKLNVWQAASDSHRLINAVKGIYAGRWLSSGASKGGMASIYHRRYYPHDVDGTVAYVTPNDALHEEDSAYTRFFERVGTDPACRAALVALQKEALGPRRAELRHRWAVTAATGGYTFERRFGNSVDRALETTVLDTPWAFWQYRTQADCGAVPARTASTDTIYAFIDETASFAFYTDEGIEPYAPYYFQAATQLGWPEPSVKPVRGLLLHPDPFDPRALFQHDPLTRFDPLRMLEMDLWVRLLGRQLLFVYGQNDPWSAERFQITPLTRDSYAYEAAGANHGANIARLTAEENAEATAAVRRWAGLSIGAQARSPEPTITHVPELDDYADRTLRP